MIVLIITTAGKFGAMRAPFELRRMRVNVEQVGDNHARANRVVDRKRLISSH